MKLGVVWLGVGLVVLSVLINARWVIVAAARAKKERALREPGYVQLLTATTSVVGGAMTNAGSSQATCRSA
jgi:cytochrome bd-type quinol oxidase subunit 2